MDYGVTKEMLIQQHNGLMNQVNQLETQAKGMREKAAEIRGKVELLDQMMTEDGAEEGAPTNGSGKKKGKEKSDG